MQVALEAGLAKLREYYRKTDSPETGDVYAHGTILAPRYKLQYFQRPEWDGGPEGSNKPWDVHYYDTLQDRIKTYQSKDNLIQQPQARPQVSQIDQMFDEEAEYDQDQDELTRYLQASKLLLLPFYLIIFIYFSDLFLFYLGIIRTPPQVFWKDHQHEFPTLARVARDVFSIPATGAGVERLFNSARDVCHYRRGRLNSTTIQDLMMFTCLTQFEMEEQQLELARSLEIPEEGETEQISAEIVNVEPISDTEEGEEELRQCVRDGKRRKSVASDNEGDLSDGDDGDLPLMSQVRHSGRARKVPKTYEGFEISM
jgi:hypothetical protein